MRISAIVFAATIAISGVLSSAAQAHPGSKLLTTGGKSPQRAMTDGMSFEETNGVHLFKGSPHQQEDALLGGGPAKCADRRVAEIEIREHQWRHIRRLRTQGFYSGVPYPSRRYTQGFYSGQR